MEEHHIIHPEKLLTHYEKPREDPPINNDMSPQTAFRRCDSSTCLNTEFDSEFVKRRTKKAMNQIETNLNKEQTRDLLNHLVPPRYFELNSQLYKQNVSIIPSNRSETKLLAKSLHSIQKQRQLKYSIYCPLRREVFDDLFTELIRQLSIQCLERGVMLKRIKDEIFMTLNSYSVIYQNFIKFGIRKSQLTEPSRLIRQIKYKELKDEVEDLKFKVAESSKRCVSLEKKEENTHILVVKKNKEEIRQLKMLQDQFNLQFEDLVAVLKHE